MLEKRDQESRTRIKENIDRHVKAVSLKKSNEEIHAITLEYWTKKFKRREQ